MSLRTFLLVLLALVRPASAEDTTFLVVPVVGTIGADVTASGMESAVQLALDQDVDLLVLEIDALDGTLADGREIARIVTMAATGIETVAIVREAAGPALPIVFAAETWLYPGTVVRTSDDGRGGRRETRLDSNRNVLAAAPPLSLDAAELEAGLEATREAMLASIPAGLDSAVAKARRALADALTDPRSDLATGPDGIATIPAIRADQGGEAIAARAVRTSRQGPAVTGSQLEDLGLGRSMVEGIDGLAKVLGIEKLETLGDPGILLMIDDANERFTGRGRVNSLVDSLMGTLETADSLTTAMPWTLERARLSDPTAPRLRGLFPMRLADGRWSIAPPFLPAWDAACRDSIRRWRGVIDMHEGLQQILQQAREMKTALDRFEIRATEGDRVRAASDVFDSRMARLAGTAQAWESLSKEARDRIALLESWRTSAPTLEADRSIRP